MNYPPTTPQPQVPPLPHGLAVRVRPGGVAMMATTAVTITDLTAADIRLVREAAGAGEINSLVIAACHIDIPPDGCARTSAPSASRRWNT